jgi:hypothetical protein
MVHVGGRPTSTLSLCCAANLACATVMKDVALLLLTGMGEEEAAGEGDPTPLVDPGVPGFDSPGVPGGVPIESFIITAGLPGSVREDIETEVMCEAIDSSSGDPSSSNDPELS